MHWEMKEQNGIKLLPHTHVTQIGNFVKLHLAYYSHLHTFNQMVKQTKNRTQDYS